MLASEPRPPAPAAVPEGRSSALAFGIYDGWEWVNTLTQAQGWYVPSSWGRDGWDCGSWPLVSIAVGADSNKPDPYVVVIYTEGDLDAVRVPTIEDAFAEVDAFARYWWQRDVASGYLTGDIVGLLEHDPEGRLKGPFSWQRLEDRR